jgi:hypothetical protein
VCIIEKSKKTQKIKNKPATFRFFFLIAKYKEKNEVRDGKLIQTDRLVKIKKTNNKDILNLIN